LHFVPDELMDDAETTTLSGSAFQILAMVNGKAQQPVVDSLKDGTTRLFDIMTK